MPATQEKIETNNIYVLRYKRGVSQPREVNFFAKDDEEAKVIGQKFCVKNGVRFIYAKPFVRDLSSFTID